MDELISCCLYILFLNFYYKYILSILHIILWVLQIFLLGPFEIFNMFRYFYITLMRLQDRDTTFLED